MRFHNVAGLALGAGFALTLLVACSGGSQGTQPPVSPDSSQQRSASNANVRPDKGDGITYISTIGGTTVYGYARANQGNNPPVCTIGPFQSLNGGLGVDQSGNLWVPDEGANPKTVTEYGPNCGPSKTVLTISGDTLPDNVAFDTNGHVYVSDAVANSGGPGNILQYTGTTLTSTLTDPNIQTPQGLAVDASNNVWVSYRDPGSTGTYVAEFVSGKMPATLFHNIALALPGSLQFDKNQNLLALDPGTGTGTLDIYAPPYTQSKPTSQLVLENAPTMCTVGGAQARLYCSNAFFSKVDIYTYPAGKYLYSYSNGLTGMSPFGIANDPSPVN